MWMFGSVLHQSNSPVGTPIACASVAKDWSGIDDPREILKYLLFIGFVGEFGGDSRILFGTCCARQLTTEVISHAFRRASQEGGRVVNLAENATNS
ncbi:MAG: hypothetical protein ACT4NL_12910 [Pseudomarimonas sp.]